LFIHYFNYLLFIYLFYYFSILVRSPDEYGRSTATRVKLIVQRLEGRGLRVGYEEAPSTLTPERKQRAAEAIKSAQCVLVFLTQGYVLQDRPFIQSVSSFSYYENCYYVRRVLYTKIIFPCPCYSPAKDVFMPLELSSQALSSIFRSHFKNICTSR
jgi:hypothetical protein